MSPVFLVVGATGKQGGGVVKALLDEGHSDIRGLTRNLDSPASKALSSKGVRLVKGSLLDKASLVEALKGTTGAFLVTDPYGKDGVSMETTQGKTFVDAAKEAGLEHLVFSSVDGAERNSGVPHFDTKYEIEQYIQASGIPNTILRPTAFYDNFPKKSSMASFMGMGMFATAIGSNKPIQMIACYDIGAFAAKALLSPQQYKGRTIGLAGDELTINQLQGVYSKVQGTGAWKAYVPSLMLKMLPQDFQKMNQWIKTEGYKVDIPALRKEYPQVMTFEQWLRSDK